MSKVPKKVKAKRQVRYYVQLARLRVETVYVEFDGKKDDYEAAKAKAVRLARRKKQEEWEVNPMPVEDYRPFVLQIFDDHQLQRTKFEVGEDLQPEEAVDETEDIRYAVLVGNVATGEGTIELQPWLEVDPPDLCSSDIIRDWIEELNDTAADWPSQRFDEIMSGDRVRPSDRIILAATTEPRGGKRRRKKQPKK